MISTIRGCDFESDVFWNMSNYTEFSKWTSVWKVAYLSSKLLVIIWFRWNLMYAGVYIKAG